MIEEGPSCRDVSKRQTVCRGRAGWQVGLFGLSGPVNEVF